MRKLFLLRHAKSSWDDPALTDFDRPLSRRGHDAAQRIAAFAVRSGITPSLALVSTARRTRETWQTLTETLGDVPVLFEPGLYAAGLTDLLQRLRRIDESIDSVILVAHNPGLERLADCLAVGRGNATAIERLSRKYPTGALAELGLDIASWRDLEGGCGQLIHFTRPVDLDGIEDDD